MSPAELNGLPYPQCGSGPAVLCSVLSTEKDQFSKVSQGPEPVNPGSSGSPASGAHGPGTHNAGGPRT